MKTFQFAAFWLELEGSRNGCVFLIVRRVSLRMKRHMISKNVLLSAAGLALAITSSAAPTAPTAQNWTEFRGTDAQGHSEAKNLPLTWGPTSHIAWKAPVAGIGWSSPVVVGTRIFLTSAVSLSGKEEATADRSLRVISLDASNGKPVWDVELFQVKSPTAHRKNSHASPTPIYED